MLQCWICQLAEEKSELLLFLGKTMDLPTCLVCTERRRGKRWGSLSSSSLTNRYSSICVLNQIQNQRNTINTAANAYLFKALPNFNIWIQLYPVLFSLVESKKTFLINKMQTCLLWLIFPTIKENRHQILSIKYLLSNLIYYKLINSHDITTCTS